MPGKYFIDTNIIIYSFDKNEPKKQKKAQELIREAIKSDKGIISYQVIQEFANVALHKFLEPMTPEDCKIYINSLLSTICEVYPSTDLYNDAIDIKTETGTRFYDALIIASALRGNAQILYSEDLTDGQKIRTLKISNPFK